MIDLKTLQDLVELMVENNLIDLDVRDGEQSVSLSRPGPAPVAVAPAAPAPAAPVQSAAPVPAVAQSDNEDHLLKVESPMVGTFYAAPKPEDPPYVKVGDTVTPDTVVCMIEAMKVFSEVKAEVSGTIKKITAKNAESVEFGQTLLLVEAD